MEINNFRGELTDISAKKEALRVIHSTDDPSGAMGLANSHRALVREGAYTKPARK